VKDPSQYAIVLIQMSERNKENVLHTVRTKRGIVHIIEHQSVLALIMMDVFRPKRIEVIVNYVSETCD
jgi:hypothetical protein